MQLICSARKWISITDDARLWMAKASDLELQNNRWLTQKKNKQGKIILTKKIIEKNNLH